MNRPINPYVAGAPLRKKTGFYGRGDVLKWVESELYNPSSNALVLFGQRRIGKTSLLLQLRRFLPADRFLPVYFDLQDQAARPLGNVLADLADTISEQTNSYEIPDLDVFDNEGIYFRKKFVPNLLEMIGERRPVLLLDEFDVLDQIDQANLSEVSAGATFFAFLRRLLLEHSQLAYVFVVGRRAEDLTLNFNATFKASQTREIWTLERKEAIELIRQAETNNLLDFTDDSIELILDITNHHPYLVQLLCQRIWEKAYSENVQGMPIIEASHVHQGVSDSLETGYQAFAWIWGGLTAAEKIYAAALAELTEDNDILAEDVVIQVLANFAPRLRTNEVLTAPRDLVRRRILEKQGRRNYRFSIRLFQIWVSKYKPLEEVKDELDQVNPLADQLFEMGQRYFLRKEWEKAHHHFQEALNENPKHFRAKLKYGESLLELGLVRESISELEEAYLQDPNMTRYPLSRALLSYAQIEKRGEDFESTERALRACDEVLKILPLDKMAYEIQYGIWLERGENALKNDDFNYSLKCFYTAKNLESKFSKHTLAEDKIEEVKSLKQLAFLDSLTTQTEEHIKQGAWSDAIPILKQLLQQDNNKDEKIKWENMLSFCETNLELDRSFESVLRQVEEGSFVTAEKDLLDILTSAPDYEKKQVTAKQLLSVIRTEIKADEALRNGDLDAALAFYKTINNTEKIRLVKCQQKINSHLNKASKFESNRQLYEAALEYKTLAEEFPNDPQTISWREQYNILMENGLESLFNSALKLIKEEDWFNALNNIEKIVVINPLYSLNNYDVRTLKNTTITSIEKELTLNELYQKGKIALENRDWTIADENFSKMLEIQPKFGNKYPDVTNFKKQASFNRQLSKITENFQPTHWFGFVKSIIWLVFCILSLFIGFQTHSTIPRTVFIILAVGCLIIWSIKDLFKVQFDDKMVARMMGITLLLPAILIPALFILYMSQNTYEVVTASVHSGLEESLVASWAPWISALSGILIAVIVLLIGGFITYIFIRITIFGTDLLYLIVGSTISISAMIMSVSLGNQFGVFGIILMIVVFVIVISERFTELRTQ